MFVHHVFTASKESFRLQIPKSKLEITGHGIDTEFFTPQGSEARRNHLLSVGRLSKSKRHDIAIRLAQKQHRELHIAGEGPEKDELEKIARDRAVKVLFLGGLNQTQLRDEYRKAGALVHFSETGSMDKVVLEALACDVPVVTSSEVFKDFPVTLVTDTQEVPKGALKAVVASEGREKVVQEHSLKRLIEKVVAHYR
jgi:glycosyltransferase involved in cell wall biosynthesis